jgi:hypothetical protein
VQKGERDVQKGSDDNSKLGELRCYGVTVDIQFKSSNKKKFQDKRVVIMSNSSDSDDDLGSEVLSMTTAQRKEFNLWISNSGFSQTQDSDSSQEETGLETSSSGGQRGLFDQKSKSSLTKIDERATIPQQWEEDESHRESRTQDWHQENNGVRNRGKKW